MDILKFIAISGTTNVTQNMYLYEYGRDILIVDCGVGFPEEVAYGVDLIIPDFSYALENKDRVRGILISHGHEDHFGALPFLLKEVSVPIYTAKLTAGFIKDKLGEYRVPGVVNTISPESGALQLGSFKVDAFRITHSVPDSLGFCITTPAGRFFHVSDYKFDWTPVDGKFFDINKASLLANDGVVALASDCLGATTEGYTSSELEIEQAIDLIVEGALGRVFFTTISSNISRIQQAVNVAGRYGRKVCFVGRSIEEKVKIAKSLGYLDYKPDFVVPFQEVRKLPKDKVLYIISGSYGQVGSALYKMALGEHDSLRTEAGDVVIFSSDPNPPGTEQTVNYVVDNLIELGTDVHYYDIQENLHVSGHGSQKDIEMLFALLRPQYLIPIGGTIRHMRAYKDLARNMGWKDEQVFELREGDVVEFNHDEARKGKTIPVRSVLVDGLGIGDVGHIVLRDRKTLAREGIVIVVVQFDKRKRAVVARPEIISRGFVFAKEQRPLINKASQTVFKELSRRGRGLNAHLIRELTVQTLERFFFDELGRRPMILPVVMEV